MSDWSHTCTYDGDTKGCPACQDFAKSVDTQLRLADRIERAKGGCTCLGVRTHEDTCMVSRLSAAETRISNLSSVLAKVVGGLLTPYADAAQRYGAAMEFIGEAEAAIDTCTVSTRSAAETRISNLSSVLQLYRNAHECLGPCVLCEAADLALSGAPHGIKART